MAKYYVTKGDNEIEVTSFDASTKDEALDRFCECVRSLRVDDDVEYQLSDDGAYIAYYMPDAPDALSTADYDGLIHLV